jgi:hypothetical protein
MGIQSKQFDRRQGGPTRDHSRGEPLHQMPRSPARARRVPLARVHFSSMNWQAERIRRLWRICRCLDRGRANGKRLHKILVGFAWRWKRRHYKNDPSRQIQFGYGTLKRLYLRWKASGGNPAALALNYRAPVKVRQGLAVEFARVCVNSDVRSFTEAHGRLPRPVATWFAYRLSLPPIMLRQVVALFAARRLVDCRWRKARTAANRFARRGT